MLKSVNPKNIKVYDILAKLPNNAKIKIREHIVPGTPDIVYFKGYVDDFFNSSGIPKKIAEKISILPIDKIYNKHHKIVIEVLSPKLNSDVSGGFGSFNDSRIQAPIE